MSSSPRSSVKPRCHPSGQRRWSLIGSLCGTIRRTDFTKVGVTMLTILRGVHPLILLVIATLLEVSGDAVVRMAIYNHVGAIRIALFFGGAALLFGYGSFLNLAPIEFGRVVGLYIATLFVVWQVINFIFFRTLPTKPILVGGGVVIAARAAITFWNSVFGCNSARVSAN